MEHQVISDAEEDEGEKEGGLPEKKAGPTNVKHVTIDGKKRGIELKSFFHNCI